MQRVDFGEGNIRRDIIRTALPMLIAQVLNLLYSIVDRVYIGRIPGTGSLALGAVGLCFPLILMINAFTNMFGMGGAPLFAMEMGRGDREKAGDIQNTALRLLTVTAVIIMAAGELLGPLLLRLFGASSADIPVSLSYLRIYLLGTFPYMVSAGMNPYINAQGYAMVGMLSIAGGAVANLILDPILIFGLGMNVQGAAAATVISQCLSFAVVARFLFGKNNECRIRAGMKLPYAGHIISLGTAPFIMQITNSLVQVSCNQVLMHFGGVSYISVMTIISSVRSILDVPALAVSEGASPVISYNYGARRPKLVRKAVRIMITIVFPYTFFTWLLVLLHPGMFIRIFTNEPALISEAARGLHLYFAAFIFQTFQYGGQIVFKALNKKKQAIFFSLLRKVVLVIPLTYALPYLFRLGTDGVFMAEPVSNVVGGLACFLTMLATVMPELKRMEESESRGQVP